MVRRAAFWILLLGAVDPVLGQGPDADWRTVTTAHFRVHYPAPAEAWTLRAVARMEAIRERVAAEVGFEPTQVIDVVVEDPVAQPNGMSLPLLDAPRMVLWTNDILHAARAIYVAEGFRLVAEERHRSFGHDLVGQNWELEL